MLVKVEALCHSGSKVSFKFIYIYGQALGVCHELPCGRFEPMSSRLENQFVNRFCPSYMFGGHVAFPLELICTV